MYDFKGKHPLCLVIAICNVVLMLALVPLGKAHPIGHNRGGEAFAELAMRSALMEVAMRGNEQAGNLTEAATSSAPANPPAAEVAAPSAAPAHEEPSPDSRKSNLLAHPGEIEDKIEHHKSGWFGCLMFWLMLVMCGSGVIYLLETTDMCFPGMSELKYKPIGENPKKVSPGKLPASAKKSSPNGPTEKSTSTGSKSPIKSGDTGATSNTEPASSGPTGSLKQPPKA